MTNTRSFTLGIAVLCGGFFTTTSTANAYPIDCAILLCLAGGWPASAECSAAKATFMRRLAPPTPEPPVQPWLCPMVVSYSAPQQTSFGQLKVSYSALRAATVSEAVHTTTKKPGMTSKDVFHFDYSGFPKRNIASAIPAQGSGLSDTEFDYLRSIKVWHVEYSHERARGGECQETYSVTLGSYGMAGEYLKESMPVVSVPSWMNLSRSCGSSYKGVGVEWQDYLGNHGYEVIPY